MEESFVSQLVPAPSVEIFNNLIGLVCGGRGCNFKGSALFALQVDSLEVVELTLVEVREVPENTNVLQTEVIPFICIRVVGNLVVVYILSLAPGTGKTNQLARVDLFGA